MSYTMRGYKLRVGCTNRYSKIVSFSDGGLNQGACRKRKNEVFPRQATKTGCFWLDFLRETIVDIQRLVRPLNELRTYGQ